MSVALLVGTNLLHVQGGFFEHTHVQLPVEFEGQLTLLDEDGEQIIEIEVEREN